MSERLQRLFERYNRDYWRGRLPRYRVVAAALDCLGRCDWRKRIIEIDPSKHRRELDIRRTLLHEMVHAATRSGHDVKFFAQMERLLRRCALVGIDTGHLGEVRIYNDLVPRRFPLLRKRVQRLEARRASGVARWLAAKKLAGMTMSDEMLVAKFAEPELAECRWKLALLAVGLEYGLTDEAGRPKNAWARRIVARGKKAHRKARREHLECEKYWRGIRSGQDAARDGPP